MSAPQQMFCRRSHNMDILGRRYINGKPRGCLTCYRLLMREASRIYKQKHPEKLQASREKEKLSRGHYRKRLKEERIQRSAGPMHVITPDIFIPEAI